jgi:hypothetical protein
MGAPPAEQCESVDECGVAQVCVLSACRESCRTDSDCARGHLCSGETEPFGCSLDDEVSCASNAECPPPLGCAADSKCRSTCVEDHDCPRNDQRCRSRVCVSVDDPDPRWFDCEDGEIVCEGTLTGLACDTCPLSASCRRQVACREKGLDWGTVQVCPNSCVMISTEPGQRASWCGQACDDGSVDGASGASGNNAGGEAGDVSVGQGGTPGDSEGAGGKAGDSSGAAGDSSRVAACESYCDIVVSSCGESGEHTQYPNAAHCMATCATLPTEAIECRRTHANLAATSGQNPHCDHAGPAGVGTCGSNCESYCALMMHVCSGTFASVEACMNACAAVPESAFTNFVYPAPIGNTLQCRIAHATNAAASSGTTRSSHCSHAAGYPPCQ